MEGREGAVAAASSPGTDPQPVSIPPYDLDVLLAVATVYVDEFRPGDFMSLGERIALHEVEDILTRYGRRY